MESESPFIQRCEALQKNYQAMKKYEDAFRNGHDNPSLKKNLNDLLQESALLFSSKDRQKTRGRLPWHADVGHYTLSEEEWFTNFTFLHKRMVQTCMQLWD